MSVPKVAFVTGSNKGIGLAVVRAMCKQFPGDVYLTARDVGRGTAAVENLKAEGLHPLFHQLDITDSASVRVARDFLKEKYGGLDVLINNAGIAFKRMWMRQNRDGGTMKVVDVEGGLSCVVIVVKVVDLRGVDEHACLTSLQVADTTPFRIQAEVTLRTNFFATRDLCSEFLSIIKPGGRVVNVSSVMSSVALNRCSPELQARFRSDDITEDELVALMQRFVLETQANVHTKNGWPETAYGVSKIGVTVLSKIHARQLRRDRPKDGILLNACCPGWVRTDMAGPNATKSPDEGAITPVYLALLPAGAEEPQGQFVSEKQVQVW